jgi:hypothetical protein
MHPLPAAARLISQLQGGGPEWNLLLFAWERAKV